MTLGYNARTTEEQIVEDYTFDRYLYPEYYDSYNTEEISSFIEYQNYDVSTNHGGNVAKESNSVEMIQLLGGPMDSPWPMYCHDVRHTGRSPYSTANNFGFKKWEFYHPDSVESGIAIADDGTIYYGCGELYAVYPDGTLKWFYDVSGWIGGSCPAIDENGIIYIGTVGAISRYFYAIYPDGSLKWKYETGNIYSSPTIGNDGTIYFGCFDYNIYALYSNGTLKWKYKTGNYILSSPAIADDGTIYCGSHDTNLYALYPNGTLKWKFETGSNIRVSPCIADDGTIYCVSRDGFLYAVYPNNGTMKWKTNVHAGTSPTIGQDGTIYAGWKNLYALNPTDGSVKWTFDVGGTIQGGTPCNSVDGTIYVGTSDSGELIAINSDGTLKWRKSIGTCESPPAIGEDGTVYIGSRGLNDGYLHAFGYAGPNPSAPTISGPSSGKPDTSYPYTFTSIDPDHDQVSYYIEWGDGDITDWTDFQPSGNSYSESHTWDTTGTYTIRAKAKDTDGYESDWGTLTVTVTMPRNKAITSPLFLWFLERFPNLQKILIFLTI